MSTHAHTKVAITSQHVSAADITAAFTTAASALRTGELVKDEDFTLFESVGALEIMDSKMDSGHLEPGETLEDEYDVLRSLLPEEVIGIMDQILSHEVAWHMGHPLSQTLFTSFYIERLLWPEPKSLKQAQFSRRLDFEPQNALLHQALRSYCLATIKACHFVHRMVTAESYYEEEDFTSQLYHRELLPRVSAAEVIALLDDGLSYLSIANIARDMTKAMETRLLFRRSLLKTLEDDTSPLNARTNLSLSCLPLLRDIKATAHLGMPVNDSFSTKIQRVLASSVPPRPMVTIKFSDALVHFETLCNDVADVSQIVETASSEDLRTAIWVFMSRRPQPSVYVRALIQSFLLERESGLVLGKMTSKHFLFESLAALILPNSTLLDPANELIEAPKNPGFQMARIMTEFDDKAGQQFLNIFRNGCLSRCRTRRTLCHLVLDWDSLQADAEDLDATLRTYTQEQPTVYSSNEPTFAYPLSSWVYHHKLSHLRHIIQMGFELTVYAADELAGMYWYLSYICGTHLSHVDRISFFLQRDMQAQDVLAGNTPRLEHREGFKKTLTNLLRIYTHLKATDALSRGLHAIYTVLLRHGAIKIPPRPYSSDRLRHELRMKPFLSLNVPEPVPFDTFQTESSFADLSDEEILDEAAMRVSDARKVWDDILKAGWSVEVGTDREHVTTRKAVVVEPREGGTTIDGEWTKGVKNVLRACIASSIAISTVKKKLDAEEDMNGLQAEVPRPGEKGCWHYWWIVPSISDAS